ncbi:hypothetical protein GGI21_001387 [Coemansia aciculifera]|nr:hypothetical protein GGI21_001387 [Coemansia aciculifera]
MKTFSYIAVPRLVMDPSGHYVEYPCLHTLILLADPRQDKQRRLISYLGILFLRLWQLIIKLPYPFTDDTVFRGNSGTLESLALVLDCNSIAMMRRHGVFTATIRPKLQHVFTAYFDAFEEGVTLTGTEYLQYMLSIGASAPCREFNVIHDGAGVVPVLPVLRQHLCIQIICVPTANLTF